RSETFMGFLSSEENRGVSFNSRYSSGNFSWLFCVTSKMSIVSFRIVFVLFIPAFDYRKDHFEPYVCFYKIGFMCRNNDRLPGFQQERSAVYDNLRIAFNDLHIRVEGRYFFRQTFSTVK